MPSIWVHFDARLHNQRPLIRDDGELILRDATVTLSGSQVIVHKSILNNTYSFIQVPKLYMFAESANPHTLVDAPDQGKRAFNQAAINFNILVDPVGFMECITYRTYNIPSTWIFDIKEVSKHLSKISPELSRYVRNYNEKDHTIVNAFINQVFFEFYCYGYKYYTNRFTAQHGCVAYCDNPTLYEVFEKELGRFAAIFGEFEDGEGYE